MHIVCTNTQTHYIHRYLFPHHSRFIKHTDLSTRSTRQPGIRAWQLLAIHPALNDRQNEDELAVQEQENQPAGVLVWEKRKPTVPQAR